MEKSKTTMIQAITNEVMKPVEMQVERNLTNFLQLELDKCVLLKDFQSYKEQINNQNINFTEKIEKKQAKLEKDFYEIIDRQDQLQNEVINKRNEARIELLKGLRDVETRMMAKLEEYATNMRLGENIADLDKEIKAMAEMLEKNFARITLVNQRFERLRDYIASKYTLQATTEQN